MNAEERRLEGGGGALPAETERRLAALAYLWVTGLVFLFIKPYRQSQYVRFHCLQAVFYGLAALVLFALLNVLGSLVGPFAPAMIVFATFSNLILLGLFLVWILLVAKAYEGLEYRLPGIGGLAGKYSR